ncbi:hypothetical protein [Spiroplasma endosymbiont of Amphibalanus improvisus]|uniref:hypothetical protein n=1 Tax=Spiroplasma endosymbiont of Amphibalanus improvisus TaxID=3066327 RepID=UPI00313D65B2
MSNFKPVIINVKDDNGVKNKLSANKANDNFKIVSNNKSTLTKEIRKKNTLWTKRNVLILMATLIFLFSIVFVIALPLSAKSKNNVTKDFVLPYSLFDDLNKGLTTSYYESEDQVVFMVDVEESALETINDALDPSEQLTDDELKFDWDNVDYDTPGKYYVSINVVKNTNDRYYIPDIKVNITGMSVIDLSDISFSDVFDINPYVTTDSTSYETVVQNSVQNLLESKGISADNIDIKFSSQNSEVSDHLNLSQSTQAGGKYFGNVVSIKATKHSRYVTGNASVFISPSAYWLSDVLNEKRITENHNKEYEKRYNQVYFSNDPKLTPDNRNNYFDLTVIDSADTARLNREIQQNVEDGLRELSNTADYLNIPTAADGTYNSLLSYTDFPYQGSTDPKLNHTSTAPWAADGARNVYRGTTWTRYFNIYTRPNNGVFLDLAVMNVTLSIPSYK